MAIGYVDSDFANPTAVCDVIMKGGQFFECQLSPSKVRAKAA